MVYNIDPSPISYGDKKYAVHCQTREQAEAFLSFMKAQYPDKTKYWASNNCNWGNYEERTAYSPCLNNVGLHNRLTYCTVEHFEDHGYEVIEFERLCECAIPEVDIGDISCLLGVT